MSSNSSNPLGGQDIAEITLPVFVAHSFGQREILTVEEFRAVVSDAISAAPPPTLAASVRGSMDPFFVGSRYGASLPAEVRAALRQATAAIVDLTGLRPNVLFELGYLMALGTPVILVAEADQSVDLPSDISDQLLGRYASEAELRSMLNQRLREISETLTTTGVLPVASTSSVWFMPESRGSIAIVCASELEKSRFASRAESNYLFIDTLEDRDALLETTSYLARSSPQAKTVRYASDAVPADVLNGNLVIIGGPGEPHGPGNYIAKDLFHRLNVRVSYNDACDRSYFDGVEYLPVLADDGQVRRDYGYFLRARNPYDPGSTVVLFSGVYTAGTLGAMQAFSDHPFGQLNSKRATNKAARRPGGALEFEAFFPVEVSPGGMPICPLLTTDTSIVLR